MSDPQASEPANEPAEPDPRAAMKAHLYRMAQSAFELQLHREFPKYKTMLEGWDGQQFFWQSAKCEQGGDGRTFRSDDGGSPKGVGRSEEAFSEK